MRRLLAISLLLFFSFPLISPLFVLSANAETNLPACCRRGGLHHCTGMAQRNQLAVQAATKTPTIGERCPYSPKALPSLSGSHFTLDTPISVFVAAAADPAAILQARTKQGASFSRSHFKRGPPVLNA